jgi:raffinose/stachyose/melibiose transport system permease protein
LWLTPFLKSIPYSFTNWNLVDPSYDFIGIDNYIRIFTGEEFFGAFENTLLFTVMTTVFCNVFGLIFALGIYKSSRSNGILRTIFFLPFVMSLILAAYTWKFIYRDVFSPILQVPSPLASMQWAMPSLAVIAIWKDSGYCMIIFIAGLQSIPADYIEASVIDGANAFQRFRKITLPLLVPAFVTTVTMLLSWGFKTFEYPVAATAGGPGGASETIAMYAYNNIFLYMKAGLGQAASIVMVIMLSVVTLTISRLIRSREVEM